jgi:hypothetical protein
MQYHAKALCLWESYRFTTLATVGIVRRGVLANPVAKLLVPVGAPRAAVIAGAFAFGCRRCTRFAWMSEVCGTPLRTLAVAIATIARVTVALGKDTAN